MAQVENAATISEAAPLDPQPSSLFIRYTSFMRVAGYSKKPDYPRLGPSLLIASCLILAIRTAKWAARYESTSSDRDLEKEVDHAITLASRVLSILLARKESLFPSQDVPWYVPTDEDVPK